MSQKVKFENGDGATLVGILDKAESDKAPAAVLSHSFTGYKEIPHLYKIAKELMDRGVHVLRFDFSDCVGESEGSCEDITVTSQVDDLNSAVSFIKNKDFVNGSIGLAGHSLGGMTSIIVASEREDIDAIVPAAAPAYMDLKHLVGGEEEIDRWREQGYYTFDSFKKGEVDVGWGFVEDMRRYDACEYIRGFEGPVRIIHGDKDNIVPLQHGEKLFKNSTHPKQLHIISGADHLYGDEDTQKEMVMLAAGWLEDHLDH
ncbi:MAG: alpha/beta hydrolase [Candidatus Nanohaloarchaea archaeon]|nr:alpha/beta hydrolase [Candidatus Nanohaloarchaea archaeon]